MKKWQVSGYAAAALAVSAAWTAFTYPWLSGAVTIPYDAKAHFQAQIQFLANAIHSGQSPFWTPNVFAGSPQIADPQSMIFSPAFLLAYFDNAPSFQAVDAYSFLLLGLAAGSVLMIFRDKGWHPAGATVAALAVAFGGTAVWRIQYLKQVEGYAFFLLCFWLLIRALDRRSLLYGMLAGLAAGLLVIEPGQIALLACYTLAAYVVCDWLSAEHPWKAIKHTLMPLAGGAVVATLIAGVPVLLTYLFVTASGRPEFVFEEAARGALHPAALLTAFVGNLFGAKDPAVEYWGPGSWEWTADWLSMTENMGQMYFGAIAAIVVVMGAFRGGFFARDIRFFTVTAIVMLIFSLGWYTPFFKPIFELIPGVRMFRRPSDATFELGAMLGIVVGYLVHRLMTGLLRPAALWTRAGEVGVICAVFIAVIIVALSRGHLSQAASPIAIEVGFFIASAGVLYVLTTKTGRRLAFALPAVTVLFVADLALHNGPNPSTAHAPSDYEILKPDTANATIAFLKANVRQSTPSPWRDRVELTGLGFEWPNVALVHGLDHTLGYNPLRLEEVIGAAGATETVAEIRQREFTPLFPSYRSPMANMLGLRYIATAAPIETVDKTLKQGDFPLVARTKEAFVYENPNALPRVLFTSHWRKASFLTLIKTGEWPDVDPKRTVLLEREPPAPLGGASEKSEESRVSIQRYANTIVEIDVDAAARGVLVLNDVWQPWWTVTVDGNPAEIVRANVLFRGVFVEAGRHQVRFEFKPFSGAARDVIARLQGERLDGFEPSTPQPSAAPQATLPAGRLASRTDPKTLR